MQASIGSFTLGELGVPPKKPKMTVKQAAAAAKAKQRALQAIVKKPVGKPAAKPAAKPSAKPAPKPTLQPRSARVSEGDVIKGDTIKFRLDLSLFFPYGASFQSTAESKFISLMNQRGFRDTKVNDEGYRATNVDTIVLGTAVVVSDGSLSKPDMANIVAKNAEDAGMSVTRTGTSPIVEIVEGSTSQIPDLRRDNSASNGTSNNGGGSEFSDLVSSVTGSGINFLGLQISPILLLIGGGLIVGKIVLSTARGK